MPTCPSCGAMIEAAASECLDCGVALVAHAEAVGASTVSGAPTVAAGFNASARVSDLIGREIIGQYVIVDKLGEGGMGEVFLADQPAIGRQVAIKIVSPLARARDQDEQVTRFRNEAKAAASLECPHIVQIFNWGELDDGTLFMAMEYLAGSTLAQVLADHGPVEAELSVAIVTQICAALTDAHAAGIIHRDLKPSNIMLIERGDDRHFAKVLDFGVAKLEGSDITRSGAMFGTPQYMSPEQLRGDSLDGRSDLYSLGVMLYEMLAGNLPFASPTAIGFITAHLHDPPPPLPAAVPRALAEVVLLLLAKDPNERPADAAALTFELRAALGGRSPAARRRARLRALRRSLAATLAVVTIAAASYGAWWAWAWRVQTEDALARERAYGAQLEEKVERTEAAIKQAREEARAAALAFRQTSEEVRAQREQVQRRGDASARRTPSLDPETRAMSDFSLAQLEAELRQTLGDRRVLPSEIATFWRDHDAQLAEVEAGELDEDDLREDLVATIALYRRRFELLRPGDRWALARLEREFLTMATKTELDRAQRQALLDATYDEYDQDETLLENDRSYLKRLAVAELVRDHEPDPSKLDPTTVVEPLPSAEPEPEWLPAHEDDDGEPSPYESSLPSLEGM